MKRATLTFFATTLIVSSFLASQKPIFSADCSLVDKIFSSVYGVTIDIKSSGSAQVTQKISLKNLSGDCFVSEFNLKINTDRVSSVSGQDALGPMRVTLAKKDGNSNLSTKLNEEVIGLGKSASFVIKYTLVGLAEKNGTIWNLSVPKITTSEKVTSYDLVVNAPASFGSIFSASPPPKKVKMSGSFTSLRYDRDVLDVQGLALAFGNAQNIEFKFKIPLENNQFFARTFSVPLPPDTATQRLFIKSLDPKPKKIYGDDYGNYWADYLVPGRKLIEIRISGLVRLKNVENGLTGEKLAQSDLERFKQSSAFVKSQDGLIQTKAKELGDPYQSYKFVGESLSFDFEKTEAGTAERQGADSLINKNQEATTLDYVDLFTALSRALGVSTREVVGLAVPGNKLTRPVFVGEPLNSSVFHAWAEFYDEGKGTWISVDPAWGDTSQLNLFGNSVTEKITLLFTDSDFALDKLKNFTYPGASVEANYTEEKKNFEPEVDFEMKSDQAVAGFPAQLKIKIQNKKGHSLLGGKLTVETTGVSLVGDQETDLGALLPFAEREIKYNLKGGSFFGQSRGTVKARLTFDDGEIKKDFEEKEDVAVASFFSFGIQQALLLIIVALLVVGNLAPTYFRKNK